MALATTKLHIDAIKNALGTSSNDTDILCKHPNVNKWSKWKPIISNKITIDITDLYNANYGIDLPIYSTVASMITDMTKVGGMSVTNRAATNGGNKNIDGFVLISTGSAIQIGWDDLNLEGRKLGIALKSIATSTIYTSLSAGDGASNVSIDVVDKSIPEGNYNAFLFLTNQSGGLTNIVGLNNHKKLGFPVAVVTEFVTVSVKARWNEFDSNKINIDVSAINTTGANVSLTSSVLRVRFSGNECGSTLQQYEQQLFSGTKVVPPTDATGTQIHYQEVTVERSQNPSWKVCWSNGGMYPNEFAVNIIQEID